MIRLKRRNTAWLTALGMVIAFALLAGAATPPVQALLLGIFAIAMVASTVELGPERESEGGHHPGFGMEIEES